MTRKILLCMGTRPEIIKMAPVYHELKTRGMEPLVMHTGQHNGMASPMYEFFDMIPDYSLELRRRTDTLCHLSARLLEKLGPALQMIRPEAVLVHGDTSSASMAALAAFYQRIPVGHVEAGLRSHRGDDPFPEEMNRQMIGRLARWHFAPTEQARRNLLAENVPAAGIHVVGNTIVDALAMAAKELDAHPERVRELRSGPLRSLPARLASRRLLLVTAHRRENLGEPLVSIALAVRELLEREPDFIVAWPVHSNPKVQAVVHEVFQQLPPAAAKRLYLTRPLSYPATLWLIRNAWLVLTDSGGVQEEAVSLHTPVLVLRETTERPEVVECGGGRLVGTRRDDIVAQVRELLTNNLRHRAMHDARNPFGDGTAAQQIADILASGEGV